MEVRVGGNQSGIAVVTLPKAVGNASRVAQKLVGGPETVAPCVPGRAGEGHFAGEVAGLRRACHVLSDVEMGGSGVGIPPGEQDGVIRQFVADFPINLGNAVVKSRKIPIIYKMKFSQGE